MLLPLSRPVPPAIASNGLGELLAELVEPQFRIGQLAIDESQSLDAHSDMRGGSLNGSLSDAECRLAQFAQHLGHVETAYTVFFQHARTFPQLKNHWWHRLAIVAFTVTIALVGYQAWQTPLQEDAQAYGNCLVMRTDANPNITLTSAEQICAAIWPIHPLLDFTLGLAAALVTFYALQLLYYKVVLYVAFGSRALE